jgi:hypothetical protein
MATMIRRLVDRMYALRGDILFTAALSAIVAIMLLFMP